jgi:hypothetical protein
MQHSKVQSRFEAIATTEGEPSKHPENCADAIENGCIFKTEREIHFIMASGVGFYCPVETANG